MRALIAYLQQADRRSAKRLLGKRSKKLHYSTASAENTKKDHERNANVVTQMSLLTILMMLAAVIDVGAVLILFYCCAIALAAAVGGNIIRMLLLQLICLR